MRFLIFSIILLMTGCASTYTWNKDKGYKTDPQLKKYIEMVGENYTSYRNPKEYFKNKNSIPVVFAQFPYQKHIVAICWLSYELTERRIEINPLWFNQSFNRQLYIHNSYKTRDNFYIDLSYAEWIRYRGIEMALSFCLHEDSQRDVYKTISF